MKALEEEYEMLQRKAWSGPSYGGEKARDEAAKRKAVSRMREIRKIIGDEKALQIWREMLS